MGQLQPGSTPTRPTVFAPTRPCPRLSARAGTRSPTGRAGAAHPERAFASPSAQQQRSTRSGAAGREPAVCQAEHGWPAEAERAGMDAGPAEELESEAHQAKRARLDQAAPQQQVVKVTGFANRALRSVLKVFVVQTTPNYAQPWQMRPQRSSAGSAFVLDAQRREIMTNAHVVQSSTSVYVRRPGNPKKWRAEVLCVGHVCDLALLTVRDAAFWEAELMSLRFSEVPELQDSILVAGYPSGGDSLSITKGIVSRVTMSRFSWGSGRQLAIQIDAAINPGNSGGPAFSDLERGLIGGVAFSKLTHADGVGYIIPLRIVQHFLHEFRSHGTFRGVCSLAFRWQDMEAEHLRRHFQVPVTMSGCLIYQIDPLSAAAGVLREHDVVTEVDGVCVADDGTVEFRREERVEFSHVVRSKHIGDELRVRVLRAGQALDLRYQLSARRPLVPILHGVHCSPEYFIIGGLVFVPLSIPFLEHAYGSSWRRLTPASVLAVLSDYAESEDQQVVILFQILAAELNFGYRFQTVRLEEFNDARVRNLAALAAAVDGCQETYMRFRLEGGKVVVLRSEEAKRESPVILGLHAITFDRSQELRAAAAASRGERSGAGSGSVDGQP